MPFKDPAGWPFLKTAPKTGGHGLHRVVDSETTFHRIRPLAPRLGITRIADITGLDRVGIPVYSAIVPRSRDVISVYNGKGFTPSDARTGALMEAVERFAASRDRTPDEIGSYCDLVRHTALVNPRDIQMGLRPSYTDSTVVAWLRGVDLFSGDTILVPHSAACFFGPGYPWQPIFSVFASNGLASGNTLEEAACHALAEAIERDSHSIFDLIHRRIQVVINRPQYEEAPIAERLLEAFQQRHPLIRLESLTGRAASLVERFRAAELTPNLRYIGSESGAATVICQVMEDQVLGMTHAHQGVGTDPDPSVAAIRALTEAAQSRAADMQAMREDLNCSGAEGEKSTRHTNRTYAKETPLRYPAPSYIDLADIPVAGTDDVVGDIRIMLAGLKNAGIQRCILVDLSVPEIPAKVVRMIIPGLESWIVDYGRSGPRAKIAWRNFVTRCE